MLKKIKIQLLTIISLATLMAPAAVPVVVHAAPSNGPSAGTPTNDGCNQISDQVAAGVNQATGADNGNNSVNCSATDVNGNSIGTAAKSIVNIFSIIVGVVAVIMIIYGGFRYITSGGDSGKVGAAKNSLIYAIVGLVIVALAQLIVHFVLGQTTQISNNVTQNSSSGKVQ